MQTTEPNSSNRALRSVDWIVGAVLFLLSFSVYLSTLAPSAAYLFDDSLEFQLLASRMAIAHPTGYPLYSILIKLATFLPFGDVAYRVNLVSALGAAGAVLFVYLGARRVTTRFFEPNTAIGDILVRVPALIAALVLAFGETFWSQAILAEVYALQAFFTALVLWLALWWAETRGEKREPGDEKREARNESRALLWLALFAGLGLTHHRMTVLLYPALVVYVLSYDWTILKQPRRLLKIAATFVLPLLLYLYLPLRGTVTSSLDGAYQNTPDGFVNWILGTAYTVFLSQNPFNQTRDAAYYFNLFVNDLSGWGLLAVAGGIAALFLRAWREWVLLTLALVVNLVFAFTYRVADINVFFIPSFVIAALFLAAGLAGLLWLAFYALPPRWAVVAAAAGAIVLLAVPFGLFKGAYARVDLSRKTDIIAYGRDVLAQPLPPNATIIGILGEMSLVRYLQETQNLRPDLETIAADGEEDRLKAIQDALSRNRAVFLTRPLSGVEKQYALSSVGPLIEVLTKPNRTGVPNPPVKTETDFDGVRLVGYDAQLTNNSPESGAAPNSVPRVTLYWQALKKNIGARLVSLKLIDANGKLAGQLDRQPVRDAYPTTAWRNDEYVSDAYDVPVFVGAAPGDYAVQVTMYDAESGKVYGQQEVGRIVVTAQTASVARELLGVTETPVRDLGGVELSGYDLDTSEPFSAGTEIPLTLLWRVMQAGTARAYDVTVADEFEQVMLTQSGSVGGADVQAGQYVRQGQNLQLPGTIAPGFYIVTVKVQGGGGAWRKQRSARAIQGEGAMRCFVGDIRHFRLGPSP